MMAPASKAALDAAIVEALRSPPPMGKNWTVQRLARECGETVFETSVAVRRLRYQGKIEFERLVLSASMVEEPLPSTIAKAEPDEGAAAGPPAVAAPIERRPLAEWVKEEAEVASARRRHAKQKSLTPLTAAERVASMLVEQPSDAIALVKKQWPALWTGVLAKAREEQVLPGAMLMTVIERGLQA